MWGLWPKNLKYKTGETLTMEPMTEADFTPQHYGIWHPEREEWWRAGVGIVFSTTSQAVALAQLQATRQLSAALDKKRWIVRCIEEWANEQTES